MNPNDRLLRLGLAGPVTLRDREGTDRAPVSAKGRGLLALLGTAPGLRMSRAAVQDKLWSGRAAAQGSASLRQTLSELRRRLGPCRGCLLGGPGWIGLDPARVAVDLEAPAGMPAETVEFAQDLDIRDPEFDDWIRLQRAHLAERWWRGGAAATLARPGGGGLTIVLGGEALRMEFAGAVLRDAGQRAADLLGATVTAGRGRGADGPACDLDAAVFGGPTRLLMAVTLSGRRTDRGAGFGAGEQLWTRTFDIEAGDLPASLRRISPEITLAILQAADRLERRRDGAPDARLTDAFGVTRGPLLAADRMLAEGPDAPQRLSLRAYLRTTLVAEGLAEDPRAALADAAAMSGRALERAPDSATVLAVASRVAAVRHEPARAADLAARALRADPASPLAQDAHAGTGADGAAAGPRSSPPGALAPQAWAAACAIAALRSGHFAEALRFAALAQACDPDPCPAPFAPGTAGWPPRGAARAQRAFRRLQRLEPALAPPILSGRGGAGAPGPAGPRSGAGAGICTDDAENLAG